MILRLRKAKNSYEGAPDYEFFCPGCNCIHGVWVNAPNYNNAQWSFNGNMELPTFKPSILITVGHDPDPNEVCHSFVTDGNIKFEPDTTHALKGQSVELPDISLHEN